MIYKVAIIGYGYWGPKLARNIQNSNEFQIDYIVDTSKKNLINAKKSFPLSRFLNDYKKLDCDNQGSILSNLQGLQSLGGVLGIAMAGRVYDDFGPKAPFIAGSIILLLMIYLIAEGKNNKITYN